MNIKDAIGKIVHFTDLCEDEMIDVMEQIMNGDATSAQIASFVTALRIKGETASEIVGAVKVMRNKAIKINSNKFHIHTKVFIFAIPTYRTIVNH